MLVNLCIFIAVVYTNATRKRPGASKQEAVSDYCLHALFTSYPYCVLKVAPSGSHFRTKCLDHQIHLHRTVKRNFGPRRQEIRTGSQTTPLRETQGVEDQIRKIFTRFGLIFLKNFLAKTKKFRLLVAGLKYVSDEEKKGQPLFRVSNVFNDNQM